MARTAALVADAVGGVLGTTPAAVATPPTAAEVSLTADAPAWVGVVTPGEVELPRGGRVVVPVRLCPPADGVPGVYEVPRRPRRGPHGRQTVTVRASPRTGGPDIAAGARATSSGDETADCPASALTDGAPRHALLLPRAGRRLSARAELPRAARIRRVVPRRQDAYASH